jgi:hypothetical protein
MTSDRGSAVIGLVAAGVLTLTGVPAEPGSAPGLWRNMVLAVHYGAAPLMLGLFLAWTTRVMRSDTINGSPAPRMADRARP